MTAGEWVDRTWSVALFGHFNPSITTPTWLLRHGALTEEEVAQSVADGDASAVAINAGTMSIEVTLDRFLAQTSTGSQVPRLPHVTERVFSVLSHTPVASIAMGFDGEWAADSETARQRALNHVLAEVTPGWAANPIARSATIRLPGLTGSGAVRHLTLEDSDVAPHGVYLSVVEEITSDVDEDPRVGALESCQVVLDRWAAFVDQSEQLGVELFGGVS